MHPSRLPNSPAFPIRILIVEDDESNATVMGLLLKRLGHTADVCPSGEEALAQLQTTPYDLVFLDVNLPGLSGLDVVQEVRTWGKAAPYVVACTANIVSPTHTLMNTLVALAYYRDRGMDDVLIKPYRLKDLAQRLDHFTSRRTLS